MSKADRVHQFKERTINTRVLVSGLPYQRPVKEKTVQKLMREWDERLLDPLVVSYRDGKFFLVDGQHRVIAMRRMNGGDSMAPCKLYWGMTYQEEADLCYKLDKAKKRLSLAQSTHALVEAGTDTEMTEIQRLVEANGFTWAMGKNFPGKYEIAAVRAVINAYWLLGGAAFDRMLYLMGEAWRGMPCTLKASFISGMALFLKTFETDLIDRTAIKRLSAIDPEEVLQRGKTDFSTSHAALRYARVLWKKYNSQRGGRKLPYRFKE